MHGSAVPDIDRPQMAIRLLKLDFLRTFRLMCCGECKAEMRLSGFCLCMRYNPAFDKVFQHFSLSAAIGMLERRYVLSCRTMTKHM